MPKLKQIKGTANGLPKTKTLNDLLDNLSAEAVGANDVKEALIAYVLDTADDPHDQKAHRSRLRLEALKVLADIVKAESKIKGDDEDADILNIIRGDSDDFSEGNED